MTDIVYHQYQGFLWIPFVLLYICLLIIFRRRKRVELTRLQKYSKIVRVVCVVALLLLEYAIPARYSSLNNIYNTDLVKEIQLDFDISTPKKLPVWFCLAPYTMVRGTELGFELLNIAVDVQEYYANNLDIFNSSNISDDELNKVNTYICEMRSTYDSLRSSVDTLSAYKGVTVGLIIVLVISSLVFAISVIREVCIASKCD